MLIGVLALILLGPLVGFTVPDRARRRIRKAFWYVAMVVTFYRRIFAAVGVC